jgi:TolA-binding protein/TM2 domain-containing membrane protein YozV
MSTFSHIVLSISLVTLLFFAPRSAAEAHDVDPCTSQFEFAQKLFHENDYERAITEYKRCIFLFPESILSQEAALMIGHSYFKEERWSESVLSFGKFIERYPESSDIAEAYYYKGAGERRLKRYEDALSSLKTIQKLDSEEYRDRAVVERALVNVDKDNWKKAQMLFSTLHEDSDYFDSALIFSKGLDNVGNMPRKSPILAGTLAACLPGAGHLYTERYRDALVAFLLNGAFIGAAYEFFDDENYSAGIIASVFELGWYAGNIYSAVGSAHKFNRRMRDEFIEGLKIKTGIASLDNSNNRFNYITVGFVY